MREVGGVNVGRVNVGGVNVGLGAIALSDSGADVGLATAGTRKAAESACRAISKRSPGGRGGSKGIRANDRAPSGNAR